MNGFSTELQAKTKVDMRNMYREKHGLTRKSLLLPGLLLLSNKKQTEVFWEKEGCAIIYEKKPQTNHESSTKKANEPRKLVLSSKLAKKYQILNLYVILIIRESCNSLTRMAPLKTQKSKFRPSAFFSLTKPYKYP